MDIMPLQHESIGGNTNILFAVDEKSAFISGVAIKSKGKKTLSQAMIDIVHSFNAHGHRVKKITSDDESTFHATSNTLVAIGVEVTFTPAGFHQKRAERYIQTLKARKRAILASIPYQIPEKLEAEAYFAAIQSMNTIANTVSGTQTPYQLVTHRKTFIPEYYFGQTGIFHSLRKDTPDQRGEWGIFLSYGSASPRYLRCYFPLRESVYSRSRFKPDIHYPSEWKLVPRLTIVKPKSLPVPSNTPHHVDSLIVPSPNASIQPTVDTRITTPKTSKGATIDSQHQKGAPNDLQHQKGELHTLHDDLTVDDSNTTLTDMPIVSSTIPSRHNLPISQPDTNQKVHHDVVIHQPSPIKTKNKIVEPITSTSNRPTRKAASQSWQHGPVKFRDQQPNTISPNFIQAYHTSLNKAVQHVELRDQQLKNFNQEINAYRMSLNKALKQTDNRFYFKRHRRRN
jgi:hypothetical protein